MKAKHLNEVTKLRDECKDNADKVQRSSEQITQFSRQIRQLNTQVLEYKKENQFMIEKLRFVEKSNSISASSFGGSLNRLPATTTQNQMLGSNLRMEDEEGELFDNTYLNQMKRGGGFDTDPCNANELMHRNSMQLPHLRDSYAVRNINRHFTEEDMKVSSYKKIINSILNNLNSFLGRA